MATLTGKIVDVTSRPPDSISSITVKAPSVRIGGSEDVITSSPATVDFNSSTGDITISGLTGGLSWLYIEGDGWSDSIAFAVADGMTKLVEAIANASGVPGLAEFVELLVGLRNRLDEIAFDAVNDVLANNSTDIIGSTGSTHANKYVRLDNDGDLYIATDSIVKSSDPTNKNYVDAGLAAKSDKTYVDTVINPYKGVLPNGSDLDTYTNQGYWGMPAVSTSRETILNTPGGTINPGVLSVTQSGGPNTNVIFQEFIEWTDKGTLRNTRMLVGGIWTAWTTGNYATRDYVDTTINPYKGVLPNGADLDSYTEPGYWGMPAISASRETILHTPGGTINPGVLSVTKSGTTTNVIFQEFIEWTSEGTLRNTRMLVGGAWTAWRAESRWDRGVIPGNTDLNNYKTPGVYVMHSSTAVRRTVANLPSPSAIGVLTVTASAQVTFQEFVYWSSEGVKVSRRQAVIDEWSEWQAETPGGGSSGESTETLWEPTQPIKVWGDSLVEGGDFGGAWAEGESLPERIGALVGTPVINEGISGQTSNDILVRSGAIDMIGVPEGGSIPASGVVNVNMMGQAWDTRANRKALPVYWAGVHGGLYRNSTGWTFTRTMAGNAVPITEPTAFYSVNGRPGTTGTHIFIMGENDFAYGHGPEHNLASHIIANYERAIESVRPSPHRHILIAGIKTRAGQTYDDLQTRTVRSVNEHLRRTYPLYYVDRMGWMLDRGLAALGLTPTAAEQAEIDQGILPTRLFAANDDRHIRREVIEAEARELWAPRLVRQGWAPVKDGVTLTDVWNPVSYGVDAMGEALAEMQSKLDEMKQVRDETLAAQLTAFDGALTTDETGAAFATGTLYMDVNTGTVYRKD